VFLQEVYVALGSISSSDVQQAEQLVHVVVDPELAHGSGCCGDNTHREARGGWLEKVI